jgi:hypothetical protein
VVTVVTPSKKQITKQQFISALEGLLDESREEFGILAKEIDDAAFTELPGFVAQAIASANKVLSMSLYYIQCSTMSDKIYDFFELDGALQVLPKDKSKQDYLR